MSLEALHNLEKRLLQLMIVVLPLNAIPQRFSLPGLGGDLVNYVCLLMIIVLGYEYVKYRFAISKKAITFFVVFIAWQIICLAVGLITYEYNELLTLDQISKLEVILAYASNYGIEINELIAIKCWLFLRFIKNILLLNNIVFFVAFYIYHLYQSDFTKAFQDIRKAVVVLVVIMGTYSFVELLWLKLDLDFAKRFLEFINPYLYDPKSSHGWWPPLLWKNQLRSICTEPSFFGTISIFCLPFLWSLFLERKNKLLISLLIFYFILMITATNARTAIVLTIIEFILLGIFSIYRKNLLKKFVVLLILGGLAFAANLGDYKNIINKNNTNDIKSVQIVKNKDVKTNQKAVIEKKEKALLIEQNKTKAKIQKQDDSKLKKYIENNILSLTNLNSRSNNARLGNLVANINVIIDNPLFGVGTGLKDAYLAEKFPDFSKNNNEVKNWIKYMYDKGVLKSGIPALNKFADIAVQNGIVGLIIYFMPLYFLCKKLLKNRATVLNDNRCIILIIVMITLLGAMMNGGALIICNGIVWGLLFCKIKEIERKT